MMRLSESHHDLISLFEHDLRANATRLSRGKTSSHFSGSCSSRGHEGARRAPSGLRHSAVADGGGLRNREVVFTRKNRYRQPGLSDPKSADTVAKVRKSD